MKTKQTSLKDYKTIFIFLIDYLNKNLLILLLQKTKRNQNYMHLYDLLTIK